MTAAASVISFNPALFIQRQAFLLDALRQQKPKSVLDVGCGEGRLLECLARCEDDLPVELLAGIDVSLPVLREASRGIEMSANQQQEDGRWRPLQVLLLEGKFSELKDTATKFDAIVSSEVIEHLDPSDLELYWDIHLGVMQPNLFVVTTPNREFNIIFETLEGSERSYAREGVGYHLRHDDHRFEYTREEFEHESRQAAMRFGYEVSFDGVGTLKNALNESPQLLDSYPQFSNLGYCTQIAIFKKSVVQDLSPRSLPSWGGLQVVTHMQYPCNLFTEYPPAPQTIAHNIGTMWRLFRPEYNFEDSAPLKPSSVATGFGGTYIEFEDVVVCRMPSKSLWDLSYAIQKLCRFNSEVFSKACFLLDRQIYDRDFMGIEVGRESLKSFTFQKMKDETFVLYEYSKRRTEDFDDFGIDLDEELF